MLNLFPRAMSQAQECFSPAFGECREGQIPRSSLRNKLDDPQLAVGFLTKKTTRMVLSMTDTILVAFM